MNNKEQETITKRYTKNKEEQWKKKGRTGEENKTHWSSLLRVDPKEIRTKIRKQID